jgi:pyridoxal phosphate enzyme (YggS family)
MTDTPKIHENLSRVKAEIAAAAVEAGRPAGSVALLAVTKTMPPDIIRPALEAGHRLFGENRVQEAEEKWPELKAAFADAALHIIGPIQSNKARRAVQVADAIQSVDRPKIARALAAAMDETGRRPDCFVQVNTGEEPQKAGVLPREADAFIRACRDEFGLPVRGLMCIPPFDEDPAPHFAFLREIARRNGLAELSMGMSSDYALAVRFGATLVRVGTAIFGSRPTPA